jgi:hypothetical protein
MLYKNNPKSFVRISPFTLVLLGAGLLLFQPLRGSAQLYFGGMDGTGSFVNDVLSANASQSSVGGFTFQGDVTSDPTLTINNTIVNTSSFAWTEYLVSVSMDQSFSIDSASVNTPADWTANIGLVTQNGPNYTGTIDYLAGTPVLPNGTLDFGFSVTFSLNSFTVGEMATPVPEPGAFGFLLMGGVLLCGAMLVKRQHA